MSKEGIVANPWWFQDNNIYVSTEELEAYFAVFCQKVEQYKTQNLLKNTECFYSAYSSIYVTSEPKEELPWVLRFRNYDYVRAEKEQSRNYHALLFDGNNKNLHCLQEIVNLQGVQGNSQYERAMKEKQEKNRDKFEHKIIHYRDITEIQFIADYKKRDIANIQTLTHIFPGERNYEKLETLRNLKIRIVAINNETYTIGFYENSGGHNSDTALIQEKLKQMDKLLLKLKSL